MGVGGGSVCGVTTAMESRVGTVPCSFSFFFFSFFFFFFFPFLFFFSFFFPFPSLEKRKKKRNRAVQATGERPVEEAGPLHKQLVHVLHCPYPQQRQIR